MKKKRCCDTVVPSALSILDSRSYRYISMSPFVIILDQWHHKHFRNVITRCPVPQLRDIYFVHRDFQIQLLNYSRLKKKHPISVLHGLHVITRRQTVYFAGEQWPQRRIQRHKKTNYRASCGGRPQYPTDDVLIMETIAEKIFT